MFSILLGIIYVAFISLGLPDSLLGSAWPVMYGQLGVPLSYAGLVTMIIAGGTIVSSLCSDRLTRKFGAGMVTAVSVMMTAVALFGFSASNSFLILCLWAIPYGLGAGAVDAALNNYVALNYASRHMSWLHCFWGVGAAVSPYIMSYCLVGGYGWHRGYGSVAVLQIVLSAVLLFSLPLWKKGKETASETGERTSALSLAQVLQIKGVKQILCTFFGYCALEATTGLWASSYLVAYRGMDSQEAAKYAAMFYLGITGGRFLCGFVADRFGDQKLIRTGILTILCGVLLVGIPIGGDVTSLLGLVIIGLGCAPVYPSIIHATPFNFGKENSQAIIGIQMASAYVGSTIIPPIFGFLAEYIGVGFYPFYLIIFAVLMLGMSEWLNKLLAKKA